MLSEYLFIEGNLFMGVLKIVIEIFDYIFTLFFGWIFFDVLFQLAMHLILAFAEKEYKFFTIIFTFEPDLTKYKLALAIIKNLIL